MKFTGSASLKISDIHAHKKTLFANNSERVISGCRRDVIEICTSLGFCTAQNVGSKLTFLGLFSP
jgi:hypothetical protein